MIGRPINIVSSIPADDQCKVLVTQSCQLIGLSREIRFPFGGLLSLCFCWVGYGCLRKIVKGYPAFLASPALPFRLPTAPISSQLAGSCEKVSQS